MAATTCMKLTKVRPPNAVGGLRGSQYASRLLPRSDIYYFRFLADRQGSARVLEDCTHLGPIHAIGLQTSPFPLYVLHRAEWL